MKATVKETTFKPITVELVIESEVELAWLKAVSNMCISSVENDPNNYKILLNFSSDSIAKAQMNFFNLMDQLQ